MDIVQQNSSNYGGFCFTGASVGLLGLALSLAICRHERIKNPTWEAYQQMKNEEDEEAVGDF